MGNFHTCTHLIRPSDVKTMDWIQLIRVNVPTSASVCKLSAQAFARRRGSVTPIKHSEFQKAQGHF